MTADTTEELLTMADKIGVARKWIQNKNTWSEHFDICKSKKEKAIKFGAKSISLREAADILNKRPGSPFYEQSIKTV